MNLATLPLPAITVAAVAVIFILYIYIAKAINSKKAPALEAAKPAAAIAPAPAANRNVELIGTDEKTAAVVMAVVSYRTDIPLNRLSFKSIKLMED